MKRFRPKKNENYWMINSRWEIKQSINTGSKKFHDRVNAGNSFQTKKEAVIFLNDLKMLREGVIVIHGKHLSLLKRVKYIIRGKL